MEYNVIDKYGYKMDLIYFFNIRNIKSKIN